MEQIVFPVHPICEFLTKESRFRVFNTTEQDEQGSKVTHYFEQTSFLHGEMEWQKKLRSEWRRSSPSELFQKRLDVGLFRVWSAGMPVLYWFSRRMSLWGTISFRLAVYINLIIALFYPYSSGQGTRTAAVGGRTAQRTQNASKIKTRPHKVDFDLYLLSSLTLLTVTVYLEMFSLFIK